MNRTSTEYAVTGGQRAQAISLTYLLAASALERAAQECRAMHPEYHNAAAHASSVARHAMSGYIDDFEGETGEALAGVIGRMAEAMMDAELHLLRSQDSPERVAGQLDAGAMLYDEIGQANV